MHGGKFHRAKFLKLMFGKVHRAKNLKCTVEKSTVLLWLALAVRQELRRRDEGDAAAVNYY